MSGLLGALVVMTALQGAGPQEFVRPMMGTEFRIVLYSSDAGAQASDDGAQAAADAAFARIAALEQTLSDYDPESELSRLSHSAGTGAWVQVSDDLWQVLRLSQVWSVRTAGAFDITVGPLTRLWRWANRRGQTMPPDRVAEAMASVGYQKLELQEKTRSVRLLVAGMRLDAGGIAKGYAADEALEVLRSHGFGRALVDAGGDLRVGEAPPKLEGWEVAVPQLDGAQRPSHSRVLMSNTAVATSGDLYRHTTDDAGVRRSHILDPRLGRSTTSGRVVTVMAESAAVADLLASAASVMTMDELEQLKSYSTKNHLIRILEPSQDGTGWGQWLFNPTGTNR